MITRCRFACGWRMSISHSVRVMLDVFAQCFADLLAALKLLVCGNHSNCAARVVAFLVYLDLHWNPLLKLFDVAANAHMAARSRMKRSQCGYRFLQRFTTERTESFVDK